MRHFPPVHFRSKYIPILLFTKILHSNSKIFQKMLINVCELDVYVFLGVPGFEHHFGKFWDTHID